VKLSKDVEKVKKYEESLLSHYQQYLQNLEATIKESSQNQSKSDDSRSLFIVAIQCMADLLKTVPHFNFRTNLVTAVVSYMHVTSPPEISIMCCNAMKVLFQDDESGEVSLEAVKLMSKMIKSRGYRVPPQVIETFLHLRLREELVKTDEERGIKLQNKKRKKDKEAHVSRKARKVMKVSSELEAELKEAEATYDKEEKEKMVCFTFIILKASYSYILCPN
jgi:nucleolar complex protein 3